MNSIVWGMDPGFANLGVAICEIMRPINAAGQPVPEAEWCYPKSFHLLTTEASAKKSKVMATDDNFRRAQEIAALLESLPRPQLICAEAMSFTPSASASAKVAMAWGVIAGYVQRYSVPMLQVTPKQLKVALGIPEVKGRGRGSKGKDESKLAIARVLAARYPATLPALLAAAHIGDKEQEHPLDAVAAVLSCEASNEVRMLRSRR